MPLGGLLPYGRNKRPSVKERQQAVRDSILDSRMTRGDTLSSIQEFGHVIPTSKQAAARKARAPKRTINPFEALARAIGMR